MDANVLIIGSGPAGYTAAIYAARANLSPVLLAGNQPGGQLTITTDVENYPGFANVIQGPWLMEEMRKQAENVGAKIINENAVKVDFTRSTFEVYSESGTYMAKSVIISTGASAKWLGIESELEFRGYGVSGCATCDGFFYKNKIVAVVGGGNTAVEEALYLTNHAAKVYLIHRRDTLRAEKILQDRLFANPKIECIWNASVEEILGEKAPLKYVTGICIKKSDERISISVDGVFIAIGHNPNTDIFRNKIALDSDGYIIVQAGSTRTNIPGIFAAGDVQDKIYRQAVTAAASGCMAALEANWFISK